MAIELTPLHHALGAELRGVDLTRPVMPEVFAEINAAFNLYGILVFPNQPVSDEQQLAFSRLFGPLEEGRAVIEQLIAFATQPQFVYRHHWTVGDLVMWDNRCTMHRGRPYDDRQRRVMHRTTVSDTANTVEQEGLVVPAAA